MTKERTSLSLDRDVHSYLGQDHVNASGLVNQLVKTHMNGGADEDIIRQFRIEQLESELDELRSREEQKLEELQTLQEIDSEKESEREDALMEAKQALEHTPKDPTNPAIQKKAEGLGMSPQQLIDEIESDNE